MMMFCSFCPLSIVLLLAAVILPRCDAAPSDDKDDFNNMFHKTCPNYRCTKAFTAIPKLRETFESSGCSGMSGGMISFSAGDNDDDKPFAECCDQWHACYRICGIAKATCDDAFKSCSEYKCGFNDDCKKSAQLQTMMISLGGCIKFDELQKDSCNCISRSSTATVAPERKEQFLKAFYQKYAPENVAKVSELVKKADTTEKMAALIRKLVAKYPACIVRVKDPQRSMYEDIVKGARGSGSSSGGREQPTRKKDEYTQARRQQRQQQTEEEEDEVDEKVEL